MIELIVILSIYSLQVNQIMFLLSDCLSDHVSCPVGSKTQVVQNRFTLKRLNYRNSVTTWVAIEVILILVLHQMHLF